jgi:hypothetical protein
VKITRTSVKITRTSVKITHMSVEITLVRVKFTLMRVEKNSADFFFLNCEIHTFSVFSLLLSVKTTLFI